MQFPLTVSIGLVLALAQNPAPISSGTNRQSQPQQPSTAAADIDSVLQIQVMLDRAGFSPGAIDGRMGANTKRALELFQASGHRPAPPADAVTRYRITAEDAAGPFIERLPDDMMDTAKLPALGYVSLLEELAERFHATPALLQQLNPGVTFAGDQEIQVPNVDPMVVPASLSITTPPAPPRGDTGKTSGATNIPQPTGTSGVDTDVMQRPDVTVTVARNTSALTVTDASGAVVLYAPVTTGSEHDPLPIGDWKVTGIQFNPKFHYNPDLFWDADSAHTKATIQAGPNNPVGVVWINLSKEHYGLHGTPEPSTIGRTQSHGCVRMTNWDALKVAALVKPGTRVVFAE
jgi:lipoprotein-anchoring transpeptidase ErfK/SrfK